LPEAYEGKTVSELGPIKSIVVSNSKSSDDVSPMSNEMIRKLIFENRLRHPAAASMMVSSPDKHFEVTFEDGTRCRYFDSLRQEILPPNQPPIRCMLLQKGHFRIGKPASEQYQDEAVPPDEP